MKQSIKYHAYYTLWVWWHIKLRDRFGLQDWFVESRPWWHLCCNGNRGGWRTRVCDFLEIRWRDEERNAPRV